MRRAVQCTRAFSTSLRTSRRPSWPPPPLQLPLLPKRALNSKALKLRSYQEDCIKAVLKSVDEGERRMGVSLATGGGKTVVFIELIERLEHPKRPEAKKTLIMVHRRELVLQAAKQCEIQYPNKRVEIEMGTSHAEMEGEIIVASVMSLIGRLEKYDPKLFKLILIDECHHGVSPSYLKILRYFGAMEVNEDTPVVVGVSATIARFDGLSLGKILDTLVFHMDSTTMIKNNWLAPPRFTTVSSRVDLTNVKEGNTGDFDIGHLGRAVNTALANDILIKAWLDRASERKSTLVFCVDLAHVRAVRDRFRDSGIDAREITSRTDMQTRRECLEEFKSGRFPVLVNCGVFTEGTDIPNIDCVVLARPTRSKNLITQMIGRGLRKSENTQKTDCYIIDMVAGLAQGMVTTPTLFGLDPDMIVNETTPEEMLALAERKRRAEEIEQEKAKCIQLQECERARAEELRKNERARLDEELKRLKEARRIAGVAKRAALEARRNSAGEEERRLAEIQRERAEAEEERLTNEIQRIEKESERGIQKEEDRLLALAGSKLPAFKIPPLRLDFTDYDDIWDLLSDERTYQVAAMMTDLAWVAVDPTRYVLSCGRNGHITLSRDCDGYYNVEERRTLPPELGEGKWARPRMIMEGVDSLETAIHGADTYAKNTYPRVLIARNLPWRRTPATEQQLDFIKRLRCLGEQDFEEMQRKGKLTKGAVGDIITRVRHGTVGKFSKEKRKERMLKKAEAKEARLIKNEEVRLGAIE